MGRKDFFVSCKLVDVYSGVTRLLLAQPYQATLPMLWEKSGCIGHNRRGEIYPDFVTFGSFFFGPFFY